MYGVLPDLHSYRGEDLEGEYWGVVVKLPRCAVEKIYGRDPIEAGYAMQGNLYKQDTDPASRHMGSLFPIDLTKEEPFGSASFGTMLFVVKISSLCVLCRRGTPLELPKVGTRVRRPANERMKFNHFKF